MASIIRIRRSTGTLAPSNLNYGELAYTTGVGTHGNRGQRLFIGDNASNPQLLGGQYYTDLLSNPPGTVEGRDNPTTPNNGFVPILNTADSGYVGDGNLVSRLPKVDQWSVDNITIDGSTIYSNNIDGNIVIRPNGTGKVVFLDDDEIQFGSSDDIRASYDTLKDALFFERGLAGSTADIRVADDIHFQFGTDNDSRIYYDEAVSDRLQVEGASWTYASSVQQVAITSNTVSTDSTSGALVVTGGVGIGGTVNIQSDLNVQGGDVTSANPNLNLFNSSVNFANILGDGTNIIFGATTGVTTIRNAVVDLDGDLNIDGGDLTSNQTSFNLLASNVDIANVLTSASQILLGATTGVATIRNAALIVPNATNISLGAASTTTIVSFDSAPNTSYVSIASTQNATSTTTGALRVAGGVGIVSDLYVGGSINIAGSLFDPTNANFQNINVTGNTNLGNGPTDLTVITGIVTHYGPLTNIGGMTIDNIGISSNVISTRSGGGNVLYIDPYPDGLSNEGTVVIKGDLQVDGTTTTVNSSTVSVNDAILQLGDVTSIRTVTSYAASGVSTIRLDSVSGINTGDIVSNSSALSLSGVSTITSYDEVNKIITIQDTILAPGITSTTQLIITHAYDTNTDRGISFSYNTSSGTENNKIGFFGYHDTTNAGSQAPSRSWTYIPDASITNSVVTGVRGYLDIKGIYYQTGDFSTHGIVYFDSTGLQNSTTAPSAATFTSTQLLTAVTEITIDLPSAYTVIAGQQVTQANNSAAYGMVKTSSIGTTITLIGVQGTFDTTNDLKIEGVNISLVPSTVNTIYTSKPMWTTSIDGGTF